MPGPGSLMNDLITLKPYAAQWPTMLFNFRASYTELKMGVTALLCGQNSRMSSQI